MQAHLGIIGGSSITNRIIIIAIVGTLPTTQLSSITEGRGFFKVKTEPNIAIARTLPATHSSVKTEASESGVFEINAHP